MKSRRVYFGPKELLAGPCLDCDADIWRALLNGDDLHIADKSSIAPWVRNVAAARKWPIETVEAAAAKLIRAHPELHAHVDELVIGFEASATDNAWNFAVIRLTGLPQEAKPSVSHAESVARWRLCAELSTAEQVLLNSACKQFASQDLEEIYVFAASSEPRHVLACLAGLQEPQLTSEWSSERESCLAELLTVWFRGELAVSDTDLLSQILISVASYSVKSILASAYVRAISAGLDAENSLVPLLRPYLSASDLDALLPYVKPALPQSPPQSVEKLPDWYERSYLPYREWMHARKVVTDEVIEPIWSAYEDVYLKALQRGLGTGDGPLAMHYSRALQYGEVRTLLVILDGTLPKDSEVLIRKLKQLNPEWSVAAREWLLATAPTITEVCRPSMVLGISASQIDEQDGAHTALAKAKQPLVEGQRLVVVKLRQPDRAYETVGASSEVLPKMAEFQLGLIADELSGIMKTVPIDRIVLTADHGRCLGLVEPVVAPCKGNIHRRAITGVVRSELVLDQRSRRLDGDLLGFDSVTDAVVARGATTFIGNGFVWYPHGGLLPEETFVPWIVLAKLAASVDITGKVNVSGVAGKPGMATLTLSNRSSMSISVMSASWEMEGRTFAGEHVPLQVPPAASRTLSILVDQVGKRFSEEATLIVTTPDGHAHSVKIPLETDIRRMQSQNIDLLDDL